jgi:hypothetical protein
VIDLSRLPAQGTEAGVTVRGGRTTRNIPLLFVGGAPEKVERVRAKLPDAAYCDAGDVVAALRHALEQLPSDPVVPTQMMDRYAGRTACQKLGIAAGSTVFLVGAPGDCDRVLAPLPDAVELTEDERAPAAVSLCFVRDPQALATLVFERRRLAARSKLWILWPKRRPGNTPDVTQALVRESAMAAGLVDYKICSVDSTWSGMAFAPAKSAGGRSD